MHAGRPWVIDDLDDGRIRPSTFHSKAVYRWTCRTRTPPSWRDSMAPFIDGSKGLRTRVAVDGRGNRSGGQPVPVEPRETASIREWAREHGHKVSDRGASDVVSSAYQSASWCRGIDEQPMWLVASPSNPVEHTRSVATGDRCGRSLPGAEPGAVSSSQSVVDDVAFVHRRTEAHHGRADGRQRCRKPARAAAPPSDPLWPQFTVPTRRPKSAGRSAAPTGVAAGL